MIIAIMQPYLFPYLGYFQLINVVDHFYLYDNVQYIKQSWINRNFIGTNSGPSRFTFPVRRHTYGQLILEMKLHERDRAISRFFRKLEFVYNEAPQFNLVKPVIEEALTLRDDDLSRLLAHSLKTICEYLGISTTISKVSDVYTSTKLRGESRLLDICKTVGASTYINPEGGINLYSNDHFRSEAIDLCFIKHIPVPYEHNCERFTPRLSIIDVMMFNPPEKIREMLNSYTLLSTTDLENHG